MSKTRKLLFPGLTLLISAIFSGLFALGLGAGFLGTHLYHRKIPRGNSIKAILVPLGRRQLHFHHWLMGAVFLGSVAVAGLLPFFPKFFLGGAAGIICHDLFTDKDWYRIIVKSEKLKIKERE